MKNIFYIIIVLFLIIGCADDEPICANLDCINDMSCNNSECINLWDSTGSWLGIAVDYVDNSQLGFSINPFNDNLIAYYKKEENDFIDSFALVVYDRTTKVEKVISKNSYNISTSKPGWGNNNDLLTVRGDSIYGRNIYTGEMNFIYSDTTNVYLINKSINGRYLIYGRFANFDFVVLDLETLEKKIHAINGSIMAVSPDGTRLIRQESETITVLNLVSNQVTELFKGEYPALNFTWKSNNEVYWSSFGGLFSINLNTRQVNRYLKHCSHSSKLKYMNPYFDSNGNLYVTKETAYLSGITAITKGEIIEYDVNTCAERKVID